VDLTIETVRSTENAMLITNSEVARRMSDFTRSGRGNPSSSPDQGKSGRQA
jgi:hypothetical protein